MMVSLTTMRMASCYILLVFAGCTVCLTAQAQARETDAIWSQVLRDIQAQHWREAQHGLLSLRDQREAPLQTNDIIRMDTLLSAIHLGLHQPDSALYYLEDAQRLASTVPGQSLSRHTLWQIAALYEQRSRTSSLRDSPDLARAILVMEKIRSRSRTRQDTLYIGSCTQLGAWYMRSGKFLQANEVLQQLISTATTPGAYAIWLQFAQVQDSLRQGDAAQAYYNQAWQYSLTTQDTLHQAIVLLALGDRASKLTQRKEALAYYEQGIARAEVIPAPAITARLYDGYAQVLAAQRASSARHWLERALTALVTTQQQTRAAHTAWRLAQLYRDQAHHEQALRYLLLADNYARRDQDWQWRRYILQHIVDHYQHQHDYREALRYEKRITDVQDSNRIARNEETNRALEFNIHDAELAELHTHDLEQQRNISRQKFIQRISGLVGVASLAMLIILYLSWRYRLKINKQLQVRNGIIVQQKEELEASLEALQATQTQMIHAEKMASLGQMTAGVAHEINNPLNFIAAGVEVMDERLRELMTLAQAAGDIDSTRLMHLQEDLQFTQTSITNGILRSHKIMKSLQTFSAPQEDERIAQPIENTIDTALTLLHHKIKDTDIEMRNESIMNSQRLVHYNSAQLTQVLINLVDNAIHALETIPRPRIITIRTAYDQTTMTLTIADNGPGIPVDIQNRIMEPFFTTKAIGKGTGLGLSISFGIIQRHQGQLSFESSAQGTTFIIQLPVLYAEN